MNRTRLTACLALCSLFVVTGCTTLHETYPGHPPEQVWTALKAAAETPDYSEWVVDANEVWVDEDEQRIEIYRKLDRILYRPGRKPLRENRNWRFQVILESTDPPQATFTSRGWAVPAHAREEGLQYFDLVWDVLGGRPEELEAADDEASYTESEAGPIDLYDGM